MLALILILAQTGAGDAPLQPSGKWVVDYADDACTLQRDFGVDNAKLTFGVRPIGIGSEGYSLVIVRQAAGGPLQRHGDDQIRLGAGAPVETSYFFARTKDGSAVVTTLSVSHAEIGRIAAAPTLNLPDIGRRITLVPTGLSAAMKALSVCQRDLAVSRGLPEDELAAVHVPAQLQVPRATLWGVDDYPATALRNHEQGSVRLAWRIDARGAISDCRVVRSSGSPSLDKASCEGVRRRATYRPATNAAGAPVPSWEFANVVWTLPS